MGIRKYCDNCNDDESGEHPVYQAQIVLRSLPGRVKSGGMRAGPIANPDKVDSVDPKTGGQVESDKRWDETEFTVPDDVYFIGTRDLCFKCMQGIADKLRDQAKGDGKGYFPNIQDHGTLERTINAEKRTSQTIVQYGGKMMTAGEADLLKDADRVAAEEADRSRAAAVAAGEKLPDNFSDADKMVGKVESPSPAADGSATSKND